MVHLLERIHGDGHQVAPELERFGVTGLEGDDPLSGRRSESWVGVEVPPCSLVQLVQPGEVEVDTVVTFGEELLDEHAELGSPVTDVVLPHDGVAGV